MQLKDYQQEALTTFEVWVRMLAESWDECEKAKSALQSVGLEATGDQLNFPKLAWEKLLGQGHLPVRSANEAYVDRTIGERNDGEPLPHVCLKVPTGGGKTLMTADAVERYMQTTSNQTGLLLWIVPSKAIYEQTKASLWNREHPYRQMLERACGGRVKVLEKDNEFTASDIEHHLCVMLLMFPSANWEKNRDFLRIFRDSGRYPGFFPEEGDLLAEGRFKNEHPTLQRDQQFDTVKHSLFNVFKICRPIVILDEAHKAYGKKIERSIEYARSINRMDPRVVIELSATPNHQISNVLVDIKGTQLQLEEMIKLPVEVTTRVGGDDDWRNTLNRALEKLNDLELEARQFEAAEGRYVRPIGLVRVQRTGKKQRDGFHIHAEDAREHLLSLGEPEDSVRVKSSDSDEIGREDLLDQVNRSPVRWIITKDAIKEGWDCSFAYVQVLLDNTRAPTALTQLVGRILRMPHARSTENAALDRCYVFCHSVDVGTAVQRVQSGLQSEGLEDLTGAFTADGVTKLKKMQLRRRREFREQRFFLPKVLHRAEYGDDKWRDLDYDQDILASIDWSSIELGDLQTAIGETAREQTSDVYLEGEVRNYSDQILDIDIHLDITYFARRLAYEIPNPWRAAQISRSALDRLMDNGLTEEQLYKQRANLVQLMRDDIRARIDETAERIFIEKLDAEEIRFTLDADRANYEVPEIYEVAIPDGAPVFNGSNGHYIQKYLFEALYDFEFDSDLEKRFARYLDDNAAIKWWHRVAARQRGEYFLRGWRQNRIFPDFVAFAEKPVPSQQQGIILQQVLIYETKGGHLADLDDAQ